MTRPSERNTSHHAARGATAVLPPEASEALAAITARLVGRPDNGTVLRLITEAGVDLLGANATGVLLLDAHGEPAVAAASDETAQFVELLQTHVQQGPCVECITSATLVTAPDLGRERNRWPGFVPAALEAGYHAVVAIPLRLDGAAVGGLNLLYEPRTTLEPWQLALAQVTADLTVLALVQERGERRTDRLLEATVGALNDRVQHGQAIGVVAGTLGISPDAARALVRRYTARHDRVQREMTGALIDGTLAPADLTG
ncbi:GAF domain-containing protein [Amycolatopsis jiangsuensis]|uniref:GAF domain-containing protein n=1 Tax=Amycolatopsis jiangsuensis TaxID=1181879 RepID=A0A840IR04_9PSEU|nr:GAF domain-containing protein [Amycolatopsis jiangsuensis]MBB4683979.1 hypothetical protein [Amycolatopsis jiangsuensis]